MLSKVTIHNWKYYSAAEARLPGGNFVIVGPNGSGKTSLLTAIYSLLTGNPWPGKKFVDFIRLDTQYFALSSQSADWYMAGKRSLNGRIAARFEADEKLLPQVFTYEPEHNSWLTSSRTAKLKVLDQILTQSLGLTYQQPLNELNKALKGKQNLLNYLLQGDTEPETDPIVLSQLNTTIHTSSGKLWRLRREFLDSFIQNSLPHLNHGLMSDITKLKVRYQIANLSGQRTALQGSDEGAHSAGWEKLWQREKAAGRILYGAQRDDFDFEIGSISLSGFLSRGETRLFTLWLIGHSARVAKNTNSQPKWLLADDVFNELDREREELILNYLQSNFDTFIATSAQELSDQKPAAKPVNNLQIQDMVKVI